MAVKLSLKCGLLWYTKKISGFRWKRSCFMASYFCLNSNCQKQQQQQQNNLVSITWYSCCLPEQVKQKENLCDHNIQLENLTMFKKEHSGSFFVRNWHLRSFCNFLLLILTLWLSTALIQVLISPSLDITCDVINLNVTSYSW